VTINCLTVELLCTLHFEQTYTDDSVGVFQDIEFSAFFLFFFWFTCFN